MSAFYDFHPMRKFAGVELFGQANKTCADAGSVGAEMNMEMSLPPTPEPSATNDVAFPTPENLTLPQADEIIKWNTSNV